MLKILVMIRLSLLLITYTWADNTVINMSSEVESSCGQQQKLTEEEAPPGREESVASEDEAIVVYEVNEVYVYIPTELSAAGFELKIAGSVSITDKQDEFHLQWMPVDLTVQDVLSLYLACDHTPPPTDHAPHTPTFPLSLIHSVSESNQHGKSLTFFLTDGKTLPTLYFYDGGTAGLLRALQRYTNLVRDPTDPNLLVREELITAGQDDSITDTAGGGGELQQQESVAKALARAFISKRPCLVSGVVGMTKVVKQRLMADKLAAELDTDNEKLDISQTQTVASGPPDAEPAPRRANTRVPLLSDVEASLFANPQIITDTRADLPPQLTVRPREVPLRRGEWERLRDSQGRISTENEEKIRTRIFHGGLDPELRREAWKYQLNYFPFEETDIERMEVRERKEKEYWRMKQQWQTISEEQEKRFSKWRDHKHLISRDVIRADRDLPLFHDAGSPKLAQLEDILRTYVMYNFDLGYVQGMSDLLAPLLAVMDNEVDSFWCFAGLMEMVEHHFEETQTSMKIRLKQLRALVNIFDPDLYQCLDRKESKSLYCCFRWLLVDFKREFSYDDIMSVWEVIWTRYLSSDFSLFIALAILLREREQLESETNDLSEVVQHINGLAKNIPVAPVLEMAEALCRQLGNCSSLPEDLQTLVVRPLPQRPN